MKSLLLVGGVLGWAVGTGCSLMEENSWGVCLWHGAVAAYIGALLLRWWGRAWRKGLEQAIRERESAETPILPATITPKVSRS